MERMRETMRETKRETPNEINSGKSLETARQPNKCHGVERETEVFPENHL